MSRKGLVLLLSVVFLSGFVLASWAEGQTAEASGKLLGWQWAEGQMDSPLKIFQAKFPNVAVTIETLPQADYAMKIRTSVASGADVADLLMTEIGSRGVMFTLDIWENLEKAPYNVDRKQIFDAVLPLITNEKGEILALDCTLCPTGWAYKLDLAEKYLGTSDPAAVEKMVSTWDSFVKVGLDVKSKSGGKVFMLPGKDDIYWVLKGQESRPFIKGNVVDMVVVKDFFTNAIRFRDAGIVDKLTANAPSWAASFPLENHMFFTTPTWGVKYWLNANDKNAAGRYGIITPPGGAFSVGGAAGSIYKNSKNKAAAWEYLKIWLLSKEGAKALKDTIGYYIPYKPAYDDPSFVLWKDPSFPKQDLGDFFFKKIVPKMKLAPISQYDGAVGGALATVETNLYLDPKITLDVALDSFKKEVVQLEPKLQVK
jgi:multiple sugar transport system substrate-binding protein